MKHRGKAFLQWADPNLHHRTHSEKLDNGRLIDVQVRLARTGETQLFIGVYDELGQPLSEEGFDKRPGETMTRAMNWGVARARHLGQAASTSIARQHGS